MQMMTGQIAETDVFPPPLCKCLLNTFSFTFWHVQGAIRGQTCRANTRNAP